MAMKFAQLYNWNDGCSMYSESVMKIGTIVRVTGLHGNYQRCEPAEPDKILGRLWVLKQDHPQPQTSITLPWFILKGSEGNELDTTAWEIDQPLYLQPGGRWDVKPPHGMTSYVIGHVIEIHPKYGAVKLEPGAYGNPRKWTGPKN